MNIKRFILGVGIICTMVPICNAQEVKNVITDGLRFCESTYPLDEQLLISNFGSEVLNPLNTEGKGYILSYSEGSLTTFIPANGYLSAPKGMYAKDGYLYICDVNKVVTYDLDTLNTPPSVIRFPEEEMMLNGIACDDTWIYVSVTNTGNIYRFETPTSSSPTPRTPELYAHIPGANGLIIKGESMYIASYPADEIMRDENRIYKIADMNNPIPEAIDIKPGKYDGLALSDDNIILYASNWESLEITAIDLLTGSIDVIDIKKQITLKGAAAISVVDDTLFIPDLPDSKVIEVRLKKR